MRLMNYFGVLMGSISGFFLIIASAISLASGTTDQLSSAICFLFGLICFGIAAHCWEDEFKEKTNDD